MSQPEQSSVANTVVILSRWQEWMCVKQVHMSMQRARTTRCQSVHVRDEGVVSAYLVCPWDAPCGRRGSADSVWWQQSGVGRPASPTLGCCRWQPFLWAWPESGAWARPWSGWPVTVWPWEDGQIDAVSQSVRKQTVRDSPGGIALILIFI